MSLEANIDHLAAIRTVVAVGVASGGRRTHRGAAHWNPIIDRTLDLFESAGRPETMRVVVGNHSLTVQMESDQVAVVVFPTGSTIAKSLRRMIRRLGRRVRGAAPAPRRAESEVA